MTIEAFVEMLESVRDKIALAIHDARRGDLCSAAEQLEQADTEMRAASEDLRA